MALLAFHVRAFKSFVDHIVLIVSGSNMVVIPKQQIDRMCSVNMRLPKYNFIWRL